LLEDMTHEGEVGFEVLTPLLMQGGVVALVDRGWVAADANGKAPDVSVDAKPRSIEASIGSLPEPGLKLGQPAPAAAGWPSSCSIPASRTCVLVRTQAHDAALAPGPHPTGWLCA